MRQWAHVLLVLPLVFNGLHFALAAGSVIVPTPVFGVGLLLALIAPLLAVPVLLRLRVSTTVVVATALVSVVRWAVFLASVNDPYAYYAWPVDVVLSVGLLLIALRVRRGALERGAARG